MEAEVTAAAVVAIVEVAAAVVIAVFPVVVSHFCGLSFCWFSVLSEGLHTYPTLSSCYFFPPCLIRGTWNWSHPELLLVFRHIRGTKYWFHPEFLLAFRVTLRTRYWSHSELLLVFRLIWGARNWSHSFFFSFSSYPRAWTLIPPWFLCWLFGSSYALDTDPTLSSCWFIVLFEWLILIPPWILVGFFVVFEWLDTEPTVRLRKRRRYGPLPEPRLQSATSRLRA